MKIELKIDERSEVFEYGEDFKVINKDVKENIITDDEIIKNFENPVDFPSLFEFLKEKKRILFIVSDGTRKTGSKRVIKNIFKYFERYNLNFEKIKFLIATGIHRATTDFEKRKIVGEKFFNEYEVIDHSAEGRGVFVGKTFFGNEIYLNEELFKCDGLVIIGNVGFHYFAGFSGGRKSILPGVALKKTIVKNHNLVFYQDRRGKNPEVRIAKLDRNPVNEDMVEAVKLFGVDKIFSINTIVDEDENILHLNCGEIIKSHRKMCEIYKSTHMVKIDGRRDIAIVSAGGYPRDINTIQSHKTIENGRYFIREGGVLVVLAYMRDGFGNDEFFRFFDLPDLKSFEDSLRKNYVINGQTAMAMVEKALKYRIILISSLDNEDVKKMRMIPAKNLKEAMDRAGEFLPKNFKGFIIPEGATTLPEIEGEI